MRKYTGGKEKVESGEFPGQYGEVVKSLVDQIREFPNSSEELQNIISALRAQVETTDSAYLAQLLFPEMYSAARLPIRFPIPTSVFSLRDHFYIDPNALGNFGLVFQPKIVGSANAYLKIYAEDSWTENIWTPTSSERKDSATNYYDSVRLTAAVIRLVYMGSLDEMSGILVGSLDYAYMGTCTVESVEDGYYVQRSKTSEGLRLIWFPRDNRDEEFYRATDTEHAENTGICIYGTALPTSAGNKIRVDIERHFEGIPNSTIRDYVEVAKAIPNEKTLEVISEIHSKMPQIMNVKPNQLGEVMSQVQGKLGIMDQILGGIKNIGGRLISSFTGDQIGHIGQSIINNATELGGTDLGAMLAKVVSFL